MAIASRRVGPVVFQPGNVPPGVGPVPTLGIGAPIDGTPPPTGFYYLRPGGVDFYRRPDGISRYLRP